MNKQISESRTRNSNAGYARGAKAIDSILVKGEDLLVHGAIHPAIYWRGGALLVLAVLLSFKVFALGALLGVVGLITLVGVVLKKHFLLLALTNKRVLSRYGVLQVDVVPMKFDKIESVEMERMLLGQILGYATVVIMGTGQRYIRIPFVANAAEFRRAYDEITLGGDDSESTKI